jgi:acetyl coenzyme A synthetase (ADP forming)-like protein
VTAGAFPAQYDVDVALRDGSIVQVRPVRPQDQDDLAAFYSALSERSRWFRFFSAGVNLERQAQQSVHLDYRDTFGLVAVTEAAIVGHAQYIRMDAERAEIAFAVSDAMQGRGLATVLLAHLAERAHEEGISMLHAEVLRENRRMLDVFRESGFPVASRTSDEALVIELPASLSPSTLERFDERERGAVVAAVTRFLKPHSVAVIGASRRRGTVGGELLHNLLADGFTGTVHPVNPAAEVVQGAVAYPDIESVPGPVDLAVIAVPAEAVIDVARACVRARVRAAIVISAGFAETGAAGTGREAELLRVCRHGGMRLLGPNCMGLVNTDPTVRLNATFAPVAPPPGHVAFLSQSGALGLAIMEQARALGIGLSAFVSIGNKADVSGNDFLQYWESDTATDVVLLYLESFGNPHRFGRIARAVGRNKPIVAVKSGRSGAGAKATGSHTGALVGASDVTVDSLFRDAGVIRADTLAEMFDAARLLSHQPLPLGSRVGIVTNAGGPGIMCADACASSGLDVPLLSDETRGKVGALLPTQASTSNPVDMIASATSDHYQRVLDVVAASGEVDALIVIFVRPLATDVADVQRAIEASAARHGSELPFLAVLMSDVEALRADGDVPVFAFAEEAARALGHAARYREWRDRPAGTVPELPDARRTRAAAILGGAAAQGSRWLTAAEVAEVLACYDLPQLEVREAADPQAVARIAADLGGRVAVKAVAPGLVHKTDAGGVRVDLRGPDEAKAAAEGIAAAVAARGHRPTGFLVQPMAAPGIEMLVGMVVEGNFGPVVAVGAGGVEAELRRDVAVGLAPLTDLQAARMVRSLASYPRLEAHRGGPAADVPALEDVMLRVGAMADAHPEIAELDCNPVVVGAGAAIVDARIRVAPPSPVAPWPALPRPA